MNPWVLGIDVGSVAVSLAVIDPCKKGLDGTHAIHIGLRLEHRGESMDNLLKIHYTLKYHPDVSLFVQARPAFCCPALVTEAMALRIEQVTGVPVVSITYDGIGGNKNDAIVPYLRYPRATHAGENTRKAP